MPHSAQCLPRCHPAIPGLLITLRYVTPGAGAGVPDGQDARLPCHAAPGARQPPCTLTERYLHSGTRARSQHVGVSRNSVEQSTSSWWVTRKFVDSGAARLPPLQGGGTLGPGLLEGKPRQNIVYLGFGLTLARPVRC